MSRREDQDGEGPSDKYCPIQLKLINRDSVSIKWNQNTYIKPTAPLPKKFLAKLKWNAC